MSDKNVYEAACKEAVESNYYKDHAAGKGTQAYKFASVFAARKGISMSEVAVANVGKNTKLYNFVAQQAAEIGVPMEGIKVVVIDNKEFNRFAVLDREDNTLYISSKYISGVMHMDATKGAIKHELGHSLQSQKDAWRDINLSKFGITSPAKKTECKADFIAGKDIKLTLIDYGFMEDTKSYYTGDSNHPPLRDRIRAASVKEYIESNSSVKLKLEDVRMEADCHFTITNKEKAQAIPPEVISGAAEHTKAFMARVEGEMDARMNNYNIPIPKTPPVLQPQRKQPFRF